ncbi:hypothetical protein NRIC_03790 [Enterococcus florum]|uniref:ASCH domain-containing protein n=1 Tax=Enterococcus florum TaxID=2480627 RepID=A0A4P5P956_9ENTE|nr:ASCH domain-containing protein [Enterococcus florum]GCF92488.1 hypothetical protein NRIC_03790 [Enterococcus florum]
MKALSLRPDYAWDVLTENKKFEYRTWNTKHRGDLLICSTARKLPGFISKHAIAVVNLTEVKQLGNGTFAWRLDNVRCIKPFYVKGQQGLFNVNDSYIEYPRENDVTMENGVEIISDDFWKHYYEAIID